MKTPNATCPTQYPYFNGFDFGRSCLYLFPLKQRKEKKRLHVDVLDFTHILITDSKVYGCVRAHTQTHIVTVYDLGKIVFTFVTCQVFSLCSSLTLKGARSVKHQIMLWSIEVVRQRRRKS